MELIYALAEPIETTLSDEEMEAYKALHTYKPHTTIASVDGTEVKPYMVLTYSADTKSYVENSGGGNGAEDGFSPTVEVEEIEGGYRLTITDVNGTKDVDVLDGKDGADGLSIYELSAIATTSEGYTLVEGKNVSIPEGRTISVGDLLLAPQTNTIYKVEVVDYYGAVGLHAAVELMKLSYTLTEQDKSDIANAVLAALPSAEGVGF